MPLWCLRKGETIPKVIFNDEAHEAKVGEGLLTIARRHGTHVWFLCDGRGLCKTCECRVLSGAENLSRPNEVETDLISESRRINGYRLACQTRVTAPGDISVISLAEQMRRRAVELMTLERGAESADSLTDLIKDCAGFAIDFVGSLTDISQTMLPQLIDAPPSFSGIYSYMRDGQRMIERVLTKPLSTGKK